MIVAVMASGCVLLTWRVLMREVGARPHLGKFCELHTRADMEKLHSTYFAKFLEIRDQQDPQRKFANEFTRRLFGP